MTTFFKHRDAVFSGIATWFGVPNEMMINVCPNLGNFNDTFLIDPKDMFSEDKSTDPPTTSPSKSPEYTTPTSSPLYVNYLGCFADKSDRALPIMKGSGKILAECVEACKEYNYVARQYYGECWCGNGDYNKHGIAYGCDCDGKDVGGWKNCVYEYIDTSSEPSLKPPTNVPTNAPTNVPTNVPTTRDTSNEPSLKPPTNVPTNAPTNVRTNVPTTSPHFTSICFNEPTYEFKGKKCNKLQEMCNKFDKQTGTFVFQNCRNSCSKCPCENDDWFWQIPSQDCNWVSAQTNTRCKIIGAVEHCAKVCKERCCSDHPTWFYRNKKKNCSWVKIEKKTRCKNKKIKIHCPHSCDLCALN